MELTVLSAGTIVDNTGILGEEQSGGSQLAGGAVFVGGMRANSNQYMIDGVENNSPVYQNPSVVPSIDAIQEFSMMSKDYPAEFGGSAVQINIVIKSGTNQLHGTFYDFVQNDILDALGYNAVTDPLTGKKKGQLRYNQYGFTLGGPVVLPKIIDGRNKFFFFVSYQGTPQLTYSSSILRLPTPAELSGDFSADPPIYDPLTGLQFARNLIPTNRIDAKTKQMLALNLIPTPNVAPQPGYNTVGRLTWPNSIKQETSRVDYHVSDKDTLHATVSWDTNTFSEPSLVRLSGTNYGASSWNAGLSEIHAFSPHTVNELRVGLNRSTGYWTQDGAYGTNIAGELFAGVSAVPLSFGVPQFYLSNYSTIGPPNALPVGVTVTSISVVDGLTTIRGRHTLKVGGSFRPYQVQGSDTYTGSRGIFWSSRDCSRRDRITRPEMPSQISFSASPHGSVVKGWARVGFTLRYIAAMCRTTGS